MPYFRRIYQSLPTLSTNSLSVTETLSSQLITVFLRFCDSHCNKLNLHMIIQPRPRPSPTLVMYVWKAPTFISGVYTFLITSSPVLKALWYKLAQHSELLLPHLPPLVFTLLCPPQTPAQGGCFLTSIFCLFYPFYLLVCHNSKSEFYWVIFCSVVALSDRIF